MIENLLIIAVNKDLNFEIVFNSCDNDFNCFDSKQFRSQFLEWIDCLGEESAKAQLLKVPITSFTKFTKSETNDKIYLLVKCENNSYTDQSAIGFARVGNRDLYLENNCSLRHVKNCFCVLDFYVRHQRRGFGCFLINNILSHIQIAVSQLAFDKPTEAMLTFLRKNFQLHRPLSQHNHFVIFDNFNFEN